MGAMAVMDRKAGDLEVKWDAEKEDEVAQAKRTFDAMREKGYAAYKMRAGGRRGDQITEFDEDAEEILLALPMQGG